MNEYLWQKHLRTVEQAVKRQKLDNVKRGHLGLALAEVVTTQSCIKEKLGNCFTCPISLFSTEFDALEQYECNRLN